MKLDLPGTRLKNSLKPPARRAARRRAVHRAGIWRFGAARDIMAEEAAEEENEKRLAAMQ
eukprot:SAG31_NODE_3576_length_4107_cov_4.203593_8_plen_60_part_00